MKKIAFLVLLCASIVFAGEGRWTGHGPFFTTFNFLEIGRSNPEVLYGGNGITLLKSIDSGFTWKLVDFPGGFGPHVFKVHPKNPQIAFAADYLNNGSYFYTRDGGNTWREIESSLPGAIRDVAFHPENLSVLYAVQEGWHWKVSVEPARVYQSFDSGITWSKLLETGSCCIDSFSAQVEIHDANPNVIYAAFDEYFFSSFDGGITWRKTRIGKSIINTLKVDPRNPEHVYASTTQGLWKSVNGGKKWTKTAGRCGPYIAIDRQKSIVYTTGEKLVTHEKCTQMSSDGGLSWINLNIPRPSRLHAVNVLEVSPRSSETLFASSDVFYRTQDAGKSWRMILNNKGLGTFNLQINTKEAPDVFATSGNRLFRSQAGKGKWSLFNTPSEFLIHQLEIHPTDLNFLVMAGGITAVQPTNHRSFVLSEDGGRKWMYRSTPFPSTQDVVLDSNNSNRIFVSGVCPGNFSEYCIGESKDRGKTWVVRNTPGTSGILEALKQSSKKLTFFTTTTDGIATSMNDGKTWKLHPILFDDAQIWSVTGIEIGTKYIYVTALNFSTFDSVRIFRSPVEKFGWKEVSKISDPLFGSSSKVYAHPKETETIFISGEGGLLVSRDAGMSWTKVEEAGLPEDRSIADLIITPNFPFTLYASSTSGVLSFTNTK